MYWYCWVKIDVITTVKPVHNFPVYSSHPVYYGVPKFSVALYFPQSWRVYSGHPVYNGHLTISQGWPLYTGLTVFGLRRVKIYWSVLPEGGTGVDGHSKVLVWIARWLHYEKQTFNTDVYYSLCDSYRSKKDNFILLFSGIAVPVYVHLLGKCHNQCLLLKLMSLSHQVLRK